MKKLNTSIGHFKESKYFTKKYGKIEYVSESGNLYKTSQGKILKFLRESDKGFTYNAKNMLAAVTDMDELYDRVKSDCEDIMHSTIINEKYDESLLDDESFLEQIHQKTKEYIWGAVSVYMSLSDMNRKFGTITSKGKKYRFDELAHEYFEPGFLTDLSEDNKKSVMEKFKSKVKGLAFTVLGTSVMRNATWFISKSIEKYVQDKREKKVFDNIDNYIARIGEADDKIGEYVKIMDSIGEISREAREKLDENLVGFIAEDLMDKNSLEDLADEWFVDYGTMNGWNSVDSAKYKIACMIHQEHVKRHPDDHKKMPQKHNYSCWHEDNCSCGLGCSWDSGD